MARKWKRVVFWRALNVDEWGGYSSCYSIRERTKKECQRKRTEFGEEDFEPCKRVVIPYQDSFDLATSICKSESGCIGVEVSEQEFKEGDF